MNRGGVSVSRLCVYPLKSGRGIALERAEVDAFGFRSDRRWMAVDGSGRFLSQREQPRLALVSARPADGGLILSAPGQSEVDVPRCSDPGAGRVRVSIWRQEVEAQVVDGEAHGWLSRLLDLEVRVVYMPEDSYRPVDSRYAPGGHRVAFADGYPFLLVSDDSIGDLNRRLVDPLPVDRFRPNLVVRGGGAFAEDDWRGFEVDGVGFRVVKRCGRCIITTIDQETAERGVEPLRTLATYRTIEGNVCFGVNLVHSGTGSIRRGSRLDFEPG